MKTGALLVLVAFVALAVGMAWARIPLHTLQQKPGVCPQVPKGVLGTCVTTCTADQMCPHDMKCCSNGCGRICQHPIFKVSGSGSRVKHGKDLDKHV